MLSRTATRVPSFLKSRLIYAHCSSINLVTEKLTSFNRLGFLSCRFHSRNSNTELDSSTGTLDHTKKKDAVTLSTVEDLQCFVSHPGTTVNDILDIDVRLLPSDLCMICLEAILKIQKRPNDALIEGVQNTLRDSLTSCSDWPSKYIKLEHMTRWHNFDLGINPFNNYEENCSWINSEQFDLLLLSSAACANTLCLTSLLNLAGHFSYLWNRYEPKVYVSILRHVHHQINELSSTQLVQLAHLLSRIACYPVGEFHELLTEVKLLQSAIAIHVMNKKDVLATLEPTLIIRLLYDLRRSLEKREISLLFTAVYNSLGSNTSNWNLYTLSFMLLYMCKLEVSKPSLIKSCLSKISRKLKISEYHPYVNQCQWVNAMLSALANSTVGFYSTSENLEEELQSYIQPPVFDSSINDNKQMRKGVCDIHIMFTADWVQQLFSEISHHATTQPVSDSNALKCLAQLVYSLSLFGYQANSIIKHYNEAEKIINNDASMSTTTELTQPPFINMAKCLSTPLSKVGSEVEKSSISWIPRDDWRFYYLCGLGLLKSNMIDSPLFSAYISSKFDDLKTLFHSFYEHKDLLQHLSLDKFQGIQYLNGSNNSEVIYFADILFKTKLERNKDVHNYVICIVHKDRDIVVKGPLLSLLNFYRETQCLPVFTFNFSVWQSLRKTGKQAMLRSFLVGVSNKISQEKGLSPFEIQTTSCLYGKRYKNS
ncbi:unnamed protein product [Heterobilharzia americana]|nr:unnamed protein product [Heterobilharzia americana]